LIQNERSDDPSRRSLLVFRDSGYFLRLQGCGVLGLPAAHRTLGVGPPEFVFLTTSESRLRARALGSGGSFVWYSALGHTLTLPTFTGSLAASGPAAHTGPPSPLYFLKSPAPPTRLRLGVGCASVACTLGCTGRLAAGDSDASFVEAASELSSQVAGPGTRPGTCQRGLAPRQGRAPAL
jgi:hypothetical protein